MVEFIDVLIDKSAILYLGGCIIAHAMIIRWVEMNKKQVVLQVPAQGTNTTPSANTQVQKPKPETCYWCHEIVTPQEKAQMLRLGEPHCNYEQDQQVRAKRPTQQQVPQKKPVTNTSNTPKVVIPTPQKPNTPRPNTETDNNA